MELIVPTYRCPRCGGSEGYFKKSFQLRAAGFNSAPTGAATQRFANVERKVMACKECTEEMDTLYSTSEKEDVVVKVINEKISARKRNRSIFRALSYVTIFGTLNVLPQVYEDVEKVWVKSNRGEYVYESEWQSALSGSLWILGILAVATIILVKNRKSLVNVWLLSFGKNEEEILRILQDSEYGKLPKDTFTDSLVTEGKTQILEDSDLVAYAVSRSITKQEAVTLHEELERNGARSIIG